MGEVYYQPLVNPPHCVMGLTAIVQYTGPVSKKADGDEGKGGYEYGGDDEGAADEEEKGHENYGLLASGDSIDDDMDVDNFDAEV